MSWRAAGCLVLGIGAFVGVGLLGMSLAFSQLGGCPDRLQWADRAYLPQGSPAASPEFEGGGEPVEIGSTFVGLTTRRVYGPPGSSASTDADDRPAEIVLDCGDGSYRGYAWDGVSLPTLAPTPG
ncbi:MAG: hypothetical protein ACRDHD_12405 [Candidatus Limnocylindria bacterium]